ncbi:aldo/keto reductase [Nonomuraea sp. NPDC050310]|uniref:aldo/keto reductase n=1 Tax=unclassified Nonomuraea TaxID=2593643 RepID=UPI00340FF0A1
MTRTPFLLGGDLPVSRLGFGTMRLTGPGIWGEPADHAGALRVLRRAVELGVTLIDTADSYGPHVAESLVAEALHPYPEGLVISTKGGLTRQGPDRWQAVGRPEYLRQCVEMSLRRLKLDRIDLYHLHRIDPGVPLEDQIGELDALRAEGKIRHIGLSEVTATEIAAVQKLAPVASVQNILNLTRQRYLDTVAYCEREGIAFVPFFPLGRGELTAPGGELAQLAAAHDATPAQLALAWLLHLSPAVVPIPGTTSVAHLEDNLGALDVKLTPEQVTALSARWSDS